MFFFSSKNKKPKNPLEVFTINKSYEKYLVNKLTNQPERFLSMALIGRGRYKEAIDVTIATMMVPKLRKRLNNYNLYTTNCKDYINELFKAEGSRITTIYTTIVEKFNKNMEKVKSELENNESYVDMLIICENLGLLDISLINPQKISCEDFKKCLILRDLGIMFALLMTDNNTVHNPKELLKLNDNCIGINLDYTIEVFGKLFDNKIVLSNDCEYELNITDGKQDRFKIDNYESFIDDCSYFCKTLKKYL